jgi:hypothetical protein
MKSRISTPEFHGGAGLDSLFFYREKRFRKEVKLSEAPELSRSNQNAVSALGFFPSVDALSRGGRVPRSTNEPLSCRCRGTPLPSPDEITAPSYPCNLRMYGILLGALEPYNPCSAFLPNTSCFRAYLFYANQHLYHL